MCGISGKYNFKNGQPVNKSTLAKMAQSMFYRGPDDLGFYLDKDLGLGFCRLSIIDLEKGHQPLSNEDGKIWLILNGEIYNFQALRLNLESKGHRFKTATDVEVVVHLYEEMGIDFVHKLNGMFSLGLWDSLNRKLILVRDRIGIKPLYYSFTKGGIIFGSELKALVQDPGLQPCMNPEGLHYFFSLNYIPSPHTIYKGVYKLPPGHFMVCDKNGFKLVEYWDVSKGENKIKSFEYFVENIKEALIESVKKRLLSDVPIGVFLSGGIDSSAIAAIYSKLSTQKIRTFSIGFSEKSHNELDFARVVARSLNTQHHEIMLGPQIKETLPKIVRYCDEPFADSSAVPLYFLSKEARKSVKVVLTGDGADELFGGYPTYVADILAKYYKRIPLKLRKDIIAKVINLLPVSFKKYSLDFKLKRFISFAELPAIYAHGSWRNIFNRHEQNSLFCEDFYRSIANFNYLEIYDKFFSKAKNLDELNRFMYVDLKAYLPEDMLVKVDRMSMANSLEARVPFLDHTLAELAFKIPSKFKICGLRTKHILRIAMNDFLPKKIIRRKKGGFNVPVAAWIAGPLRPMIEDIFSSQEIRKTNIFNFDYIDRLLKEHFLHRHDHGYKIWCLLIFFLWYLEFRNK
ncbi:MAG: asparagine synthase (glutamine-hydrolyzing) [Candidatus Omnitrophica bacterium]|nr:asparagine synthase (glutamine-hydrolyzing) [Candidatus Omnitrophota bacterium]